ncbi:MAG: DNA mismatch repair protein MutS [Butyricicoccaceae bacterium]
MAELVPMLRQYFDLKEQCPGCILLYRIGDFYEMFYEDAKLVSGELDLVLTKHASGLDDPAPMCGIPYHSAETYLARLVRKGYKVAIAEQMMDPKACKGLVPREIVRVMTPGTVLDASMLDEKSNNYIASVCAFGGQLGLCLIDITTGEALATGSADSTAVEYIMSELGRFLPREVLINGQVSETELPEFLSERLDCRPEVLDEAQFDPERCFTVVTRQFPELEHKALTENPAVCGAVGALLTHLEELQKTDLSNLETLTVYRHGQYMELDLNARRNLELCETMRTKEKRGSLLWVLDRTCTSMGARLMRAWMCKPLLSPALILQRQGAVGELLEEAMLRGDLRECLRGVLDLERLIGRVVYGTANARDLRSMCLTLEQLPEIRMLLAQAQCPMLETLCDSMDDLHDLRELIAAAIVDEPPLLLREGGFIREGYNEELDRLRDISTGGRSQIAAIEQREREATGISKLKVGYNKVFGYYIEVSRLQAAQVPGHYIRKQTLANTERYITEELKEYENTVLGAQEKITDLEYQLFVELRETLAEQVHRVQATAQALATVDVLAALAEDAEEYDYVCPEIDYAPVIEIQDGRHPVVERVLRDTMFIANDTKLDDRANRIAVITGPNMAGKSTYMRQVALITLMAQMGSFVPAKSARIGVTDRIFTRVGASDDLASGQSTFMVEMSEVADILNHATAQSLIVLDEIGRGTSTFDGMSIARAVVEYIADKKKIGARTLFATHYHELTALEELMDGVKNYNIAVKKRGDDITFLRKIVPGGADDSYGIAVAKLAGVPNPVIRRAKQILKDLESSAPKIDLRETASDEPEEQQVSLLDLKTDEITARLEKVNVNTMTPIEALNLIYELQKMIQS